MIKKLTIRTVWIMLGGAFCATYALLVYLGSTNEITQFITPYYVGTILGFMTGHFYCTWYVMGEVDEDDEGY